MAQCCAVLKIVKRNKTAPVQKAVLSVLDWKPFPIRLGSVRYPTKPESPFRAF